MAASPFALRHCTRTTQDGIVQHGWTVVLIKSSEDAEPLHEPWYGVFSRQLACAFLDGVLLAFFVHQKGSKRHT
jgi:hypothetical protein